MAPIMLSCIILSIFNVVCGAVPVLLWESGKTDRIKSFPALHRTRSEDFLQYILKKVQKVQPFPLIAVFATESLSMEDYSHQDLQGRGYFPQLKYITETASNVEFLPSVQDPIEAIKQLSEFGFSLKYIDSGNTVDLPYGCGKILIVNLQEAVVKETRSEQLRCQDLRTAEVYRHLLSKCSHVIGLLSGHQSSWVEPQEVTRIRRSAKNMSNTTSVSGPYTLYQDQAGLSLLFSNSVPNLTYDANEISIKNYTVNILGSNTQASLIQLIAMYGTDYRITFNFDNQTSGYWYLRMADLQVGSSPGIILRTSMDIAAPLGLSFQSSSPVTFKNGNTAFTFADLQVQPFFLNQGSKAFSEAVNAVGFFTPAILSGLLVIFLMSIIFTWGISMILNIRTMDQFEDPKGKTFSITAFD